MYLESLALSSLEYERSKRIFFFGSLIPTFFINLFFIIAVLYTFFTGFPTNGNLSASYTAIVLLRAFIWELEFLAMFHVTILIPWLFSENNLDVFLFKASFNTDIIIIGKILAIIKQQIIFILIFYSIGLGTFILTVPFSLTIAIVIKSIIALILGLILTDLVVLAICLIVKKLLKSMQIGSTIISLYLFALPLLLVILLSYGFLPSEFTIINLPIQLQEVNNIIVSTNPAITSGNWNLPVIILLELGLSLLIVKKVNINFE